MKITVINKALNENGATYIDTNRGIYVQVIDTKLKKKLKEININYNYPWSRVPTHSFYESIIPKYLVRWCWSRKERI